MQASWSRFLGACYPDCHPCPALGQDRVTHSIPSPSDPCPCPPVRPTLLPTSVGTPSLLERFGRFLPRPSARSAALPEPSAPLGSPTRREASGGRGVRIVEEDLVVPCSAPFDLRVALLSELPIVEDDKGGTILASLGALMGCAPDAVLLLPGGLRDDASSLRGLSAVLGALSPRLGTFVAPSGSSSQGIAVEDSFGSDPDLAGLQILRDRGLRLADGVWLAGVESGDEIGGEAARLERSLEGRTDEEVTLLLSQSPEAFAYALRAGVDLHVSGATSSPMGQRIGGRLERLLRRGEEVQRLPVDPGKHWIQSRLLYLCDTPAQDLENAGRRGVTIPILRLRSHALPTAAQPLAYSRCS